MLFNTESLFIEILLNAGKQLVLKLAIYETIKSKSTVEMIQSNLFKNRVI